VVALNFGNLVAMLGVVLHAAIPVVLLVLVVVIVFFFWTQISPANLRRHVDKKDT